MAVAFMAGSLGFDAYHLDGNEWVSINTYSLNVKNSLLYSLKQEACVLIVRSMDTYTEADDGTRQGAQR